MGRTGVGFTETIVAIIEDHTDKITAENIRSRSSSAGKFQSVTITIEVTSRHQLERIYRALSACEQVLWTL